MTQSFDPQLSLACQELLAFLRKRGHAVTFYREGRCWVCSIDQKYEGVSPNPGHALRGANTSLGYERARQIQREGKP